MRFARLFQPRNPWFWVFVVLNALSTVISHVLRTHELPLPLALVLAGFALGNLVYGIRIARQLMREPDPAIRVTETG